MELLEIDFKEENQVKKSKVQSTKARHNDGLTCSMVEGPVMGLEQRRRVFCLSMY